MACVNAPPDVNQVGDNDVPVEVRGAPRGGVEHPTIVLRDLLAGEPGVTRGELGHERADRYAIGLAISKRCRIAAQPLLVALFHRAWVRVLGLSPTLSVGLSHGVISHLYLS